MSNTELAYAPGVCNINRNEIARRRRTGHIGLAIFIVFLASLLLSELAPYYRVALFIPAFLSAIGYLQARHKFCVGYATASLQNAAEGSSVASAITDPNAVQADKRRAQRLQLQALLIALIFTAVSCMLPRW